MKFLRLSGLFACLVLSQCGNARAVAATIPGASKFTEIDGIRIHYVDAGKGAPTLVLVHGWCCDLTVWRLQMPALFKRMRVLAVDLPGHGKSDKPKTKYTMDLFARAVDAVMRDAGVDKAVFVGHSNGTPVVRQFYRLFPKKTMGLVAVDGAFRSFFRDPKMVEGFLAPMRAENYQEYVTGFVDGMMPTKAPDDVRRDIRTRMLATPQHVMVGGFEAALDPAIWKEDPIEVPLLAVMARAPFWTEEYQEFLRKLAPRLEWHMLDGVSHFLMMEDPERFDAILEGFLKKNGWLESGDAGK